MHPNQRSHRDAANVQDMLREVDCNRPVLTIVAVTAEARRGPSIRPCAGSLTFPGRFPSQVGFLAPGAWHFHDRPDDHTRDFDVLGLGVDADASVLRVRALVLEFGALGVDAPGGV